MFGFSGQVEEDEDVNDNWSCPSTYKHFNPTVKPRSKLGRRRLVQPKDEKVQDTDVCNNGASLKQLNAKQSQWLQKDDSGFLTSDSTPSLTHPVSNPGTLFRNFSKPEPHLLVPGFTPSSYSERENVFFDKFLLPTTPCRPYRNDPLKEINNVMANSSSSSSGSSTLVSDLLNKGGNSVQKQLNSSFICDESLQSMNSGDLPQNSIDTNKISGLLTNYSDASNDSSFMTAHDIHRPENQTNKTVYDHEFLKTPGKNLAEIRIEESPFNPLEEYLEDTDDFAVCESKISPLKSNDSLANLPAQQAYDTSGSDRKNGFINPQKNEVKSGDNPVDDTDPVAYPLVNESIQGKGSWDFFGGASKHPNELSLMRISGRNRPEDNHFKHPGFGFETPQACSNKFERHLNSSDVGNLKLLEPLGADAVLKSDNIEETSNVTYPQHARNNLPQKNSFTSQFSLNQSSYKNNLGFYGNGLAGSGPSKPLSAASCPTTKGLISTSMGELANPSNSTRADRSMVVPGVSVSMSPQLNQGDHSDTIASGNRSSSRDDRTGSNINKRQVDHRSDKESKDASSFHQRVANSSAKEQVIDQLDGSITWISCVKTPKTCGFKDSERCASTLKIHRSESQNSHNELTNVSSSFEQDMKTVVLNEVSVIPQQLPSTNTIQQQGAAIGGVPICNTPASSDNLHSGGSVMSALIKPQPQNVITIKGTSYTVLSFIGKGGSSQVYQALGPQSSKLMAIKCVNLATVEDAMATDYLNEIALLSKLQGCPSVIKMIDCEYVEQSQMLYVVLEKGDIDFSKLIKNITETKQISMSMIVYYWTEMLNAVLEIHKRGIIHSDLKPANFLLVEGRLKLIDFGIASSIQGDTTSVMKEVPAGTYNYMSPEAIRGPKITRKSDVWSLGCILFNLLYGRTPFSHLNNRWQKLHAIADPNHKVSFPKMQFHTPPSLRLALRWCLIKDPTLRPTVEELAQLSELSPHVDSCLGKEIDGMMCKYFRKVIPNLRILNEDEDVG